MIIDDQWKQQLADFRDDFRRLRDEISKVIVGQSGILEDTLIALIAGGHVLLEGVPGLGKTLTVRTLADSLHLAFHRIQFTPDLMPADLIGTNIIAEDPEGRKRFEFQKVRYSPMSYWRTRSIARHPKHNRRCWRRCKSIRSPWPE